MTRARCLAIGLLWIATPSAAQEAPASAPVPASQIAPASAPASAPVEKKGKKKKDKGQPSSEQSASSEQPEKKQGKKKKKNDYPPGLSYQPERGLIWSFSKDVRLRLDAMAQLEGTNDADAVEAGQAFFPRRLRVTLRGKLTDWVDVKSSLDLAPLINLNPGDEDDDGELFADQFLALNLTKDLGIRAGYFRAPFGRQRMNSSSTLLLPDRSQVTGQLTFDRGLGAAVFGERGKKEFFTYEAGVTADVLLAAREGLAPLPVLAARAVLNPRGGLKAEEGALSPVDELRYSFGANVAVPFGAQNDLASPSFGLDAAAERGRLSGLLEVMVRSRQVEDPRVVDGVAVGVPNGDTQAQAGVFGQLGVLVWPERVQLGARAGVLAPDPNLNDKLNTQGQKTELTGGANFFLVERRLMLQTQLTRRVEAADETHGENRETILSAQLQAAL